MYINEHGVTGSSILITCILISQRIFPDSYLSLITFFAIGSILAFTSHFVMDYLNEYHYKIKNGWIRAQLYSYFIFLACISYLFFKEEYLYSFTILSGYLIANFPDIIDKGVLFLKGRQRKDMFSSHNGSGYLSIGNWKLGYPTIYSLNKEEQTIIQLIFTIILILITIAISIV